jgi:hypothetical protein
MPLKPNLEDQELFADTLRRADAPMSMRERLTEILVGCGFLAAVALLWWAHPPGSFALIPAGLCLLMMVLATRVRFETPFGFTVATQLAFVPLLFALPIAIVPVAVVASLAIASLPEVLTGRARADRLLLAVGNSWFAIGAVTVFVIRRPPAPPC